MAVYLDYAAATPLDKRVFLAMKPFLVKDFFNPSADYQPARDVKNALNQARSSVAQIIGAKSAEIVFTAGATEANNLAIQGIMKEYPQANLAISAIEHDSVRFPAAEFKHNLISVTKDGLIDLDKLPKAIDDSTVLISVIMASNEVGTIQPLKKISEIISGIKRQRLADGNKLPLYFHTDASQAPNYLDLHVHRLGLDLASFNGGKIYGPKQSGALFVGSDVRMRPLIVGGGQENGLRSGTENVAYAVGFSKALEVATRIRSAEVDRVKDLQDYFIQLLKNSIPSARINGSLKKRLPNNLNITIDNIDNERVLIALDIAGVYAAAGSACSASKQEPSAVLKSLGLSDGEIRSSLRFSMGRQTSKSDIEKAVKSLAKLVKL